MESPDTPQPIVRHQGRGGFVEIDGYRYGIESMGDGRFTISFPGGNRHRRLQAHLTALPQLAAGKSPKWCVEDRSKNHD
ncbi:MAG: hypothetical protein ACXIUZ_11505 [Lysobacteraceae bacterium]